MPLTGREYADRIARYLVRNYAARGIAVYREVNLGKTIIGKDRRIDILAIHGPSGRALAVECKYQDLRGTTDEKIPYALDDLAALRISACLCYAGDGFSPGIRHLLAASHLAAACLPDETLAPTIATRELDHILAMTFGWWDLVVGDRTPVRLEEPIRAAAGIVLAGAAAAPPSEPQRELAGAGPAGAAADVDEQVGR
jgi:hypothetical protein